MDLKQIEDKFLEYVANLEKQVSNNHSYDRYLDPKLNLKDKTHGLYAFWSKRGKRFVYIGITRNLRGRFKQHISKNRHSSTLAYHVAGYNRSESTRQEFFENNKQGIINATETIRTDFVPYWIEKEDGPELHMLEIWLIVNLDTLKRKGGYNEIRTH